jgi:hypothetical protein
MGEKWLVRGWIAMIILAFLAALFSPIIQAGGIG